MNHDGIYKVSNDWYKSYLSNHNQYVSINESESDLPAKNCGIPEGSVLGPLFLLYINDLNQTIKICNAHHWTNWIKKLKKLVNTDLKHLFNWLNANKISLNIKNWNFNL